MTVNRVEDNPRFMFFFASEVLRVFVNKNDFFIKHGEIVCEK